MNGDENGIFDPMNDHENGIFNPDENEIYDGTDTSGNLHSVFWTDDDLGLKIINKLKNWSFKK